jgi:hypothetical protein
VSYGACCLKSIYNLLKLPASQTRQALSFIEDVPAATAIPDRFLESAEVIQITGRSFRLHGHQADKYSAMPEEESEDSGSKPATSKTGQTRTPGPVEKTNRKSSK